MPSASALTASASTGTLAREWHDHEPDADQRKAAEQQPLLAKAPRQPTDQPALQDRRSTPT